MTNDTTTLTASQRQSLREIDLNSIASNLNIIAGLHIVGCILMVLGTISMVVQL